MMHVRDFARLTKNGGPISSIAMTKISVRDRAKQWIERLPVGTVFENSELYAYLQQNYPTECAAEWDAAGEPQFRNTARWAIQWAKGGRGGRPQPIVQDVSTGVHRRVAPIRAHTIT
jgi:hypothetical protein